MTELGEIPIEWKVKKLGELTKVIRGASPRPKGDPRYYGGNIPRLMIADVSRDGKYVIPQIDFLTGEGAKKSRPMKKGDLVISISGTVALPTFLAVDACIHDGFMGFIEIDDSILKEFLYYQILYLRELLISQATDGGVYINLTTDIVKDFNVLVPTIKEQEKIASILSTVDEQIDNVDELIQKNKELKKGLMQQLLTKGIGHKKFKKTEVGEIPEEWEVKLLGELAQFIGSGVTPKGGENVYKDSGIPFIRSQNVYPNRLILENVAFIDEVQHKKMKRTEVVERDVLLNITGASIGRCTDVPVGFNKGNVNQHVCIIRLNEYANEKFISTTINSPLVKKQIDSFNGGSSREGLNFQQVRAIKIGVPKIKEQLRIAIIISEVDNKIEEYEVNKQKLERLKKGLMQQLLTGKKRVI